MKVRQAMRLLISGKPYSDESFMGYILRVTEKNGYESLSWIFQIVDMDYQHPRQGCAIAFEASSYLTRLAQLAGISSAEIIRLTYPSIPSSEEKSLHLFFGQSVRQYLIQSNHPRICPACLSESQYCRRIWEFSAVTTCPTHRQRLIDECPRCNKRVSWSRNNVAFCPCKFDWRLSPATPVVEQELGLTRHIYQLCGLPAGGNSKRGFSEQASKLSLNDFLTALFFIVGQSQGISSVTSKHLVAKKTKQNFHDLLTKAFSVFENWPNNYFGFLERRAVQEKSVTRSYERMKSTLYSDFGSFYSGLHDALSGNRFDFMRSAFIDYISQNRVPGCLPVSMRSGIDKDSFKGQYILKSDVRRLLRVDNVWINRQIEIGKLKTLTRSKGKKRLIFIKVEDIARLKIEH